MSRQAIDRELPNLIHGCDWRDDYVIKRVSPNLAVIERRDAPFARSKSSSTTSPSSINTDQTSESPSTMSSQRGAPSSPDNRQSTPLFMPTSSPARPASSASLTPRMARLTTGQMSSIGASSPLFYGGTSSSVGRRTPGPRSTASLSRSDLTRSFST